MRAALGEDEWRKLTAKEKFDEGFVRIVCTRPQKHADLCCLIIRHRYQGKVEMLKAHHAMMCDKLTRRGSPCSSPYTHDHVSVNLRVWTLVVPWSVFVNATGGNTETHDGIMCM